MSLQSNLVAAFARLVLACNALAGRVQPPGGSAGQVLTKTAAADYAAAWQTPAGGGDPTSTLFNSALQPVDLPYRRRFRKVRISLVGIGITPASYVWPTLLPTLENDAEDIADWTVRAVCGLDFIDFFITGRQPIGGYVQISYFIRYA